MADDVQVKIAAVWNSMLKYQLRAQGVTLDT